MSLMNYTSAVEGSIPLSRHPGHFPEPVAPDVVRCDPFWDYQAPPEVDHCWDVWNLLPQGANAEPWYTRAISPTIINRLPLALGDERCRLQISASGKAAQSMNFPVLISGQTMRLMIGRAIKTCVDRSDPSAGVMTRSIRRTLDWLTSPDINFPESLDIPQSTTFITAWVYSEPHAAMTYEPGANSQQIGEVIVEHLDEAASAQPAGSALRAKLGARHDYINHAVLHQDLLAESIGWPAWWSDVGPDPHLLLPQGNQSLDSNESVGATSGTGGVFVGSCAEDSNGSGLVDCEDDVAQRRGR